MAVSKEGLITKIEEYYSVNFDSGRDLDGYKDHHQA